MTQLNESVDLTFSPDGTLDFELDGKGTETDYSYDSLLRLTSINQDKAGTNPETANSLTQLGYDTHDNLTSVVDLNNGTTTYVYDDMGNLTSQDSPDTGMTTYTHDEAGNVLTMIDAKGQQFAYSYDELNRLISIDAPNTNSDITNTYDNCMGGTGRLCSITRQNSMVFYSYNAFGDIATVNQTVDSWTGLQAVNTQITYEYDSVGRIKNITYPSGNKFTTGYDVAGNENTLTLNDDEVSMVSGATYHPFGPLMNQSRGNGYDLWSSADMAYRTRFKGNGYIFFENISAIDENGNVLNSYVDGLNQHGYDELNRLDISLGFYGEREYGYDKVGNRLSLAIDSALTEYTYEAENNRMSAAAGVPVTIDAMVIRFHCVEKPIIIPKIIDSQALRACLIICTTVRVSV